MKIKVLIIGGSGQIGFYLSKLLVNKNIEVYISTRNPIAKKLDKFKNQTNGKINIVKLNIFFFIKSFQKVNKNTNSF